MTKEVDWRVARAYVLLEDGDKNGDEIEGNEPAGVKEGKEYLKEKRAQREGFGEGVEGRAVDRYLDDDEWENDVGGKVDIQKFPGTSGQGSSSGAGRSGRTRGGLFGK